MIYIPPGGGTPRVTPAAMPRTEANALRRAARGARGNARGRGVPAPPAPERPHLSADALAAEVDARLAEQAETWRSRREARRTARAEFAAARDAGLRSRHAAKLARNHPEEQT